MTLLKGFMDVFNPLMKENGFKRSGCGYCRIYGDGILQGITLVPLSFYRVRFACYPYWLHDYINAFRGIYDLKKNAWMQEFEISLMMTHYNKNNEEELYENMNIWLSEVVEKAMPILNKVKDYKTYSEVCETEPLFINTNMLNQYYILYICYLNGSFDYAAHYLNFQKEDIKKSYIGKQSEAWIEDHYNMAIDGHYKVLIKKMNENDLNFIKPLYDAKCIELKERIKNDLKLVID